MDGDRDDEASAVATEPEAEAAAVREEGPATRFDPTPYMRQLRGRGGGSEYLDVKWRLLWLRKEHPDAEIVTEHVQIEPTLAIFKATVTLPAGGKATGYGSETAGDFGDFIEKAETKAIGRALNALGYGAQFGDRGDEEPAVPARVGPPRTTVPSPGWERPAADVAASTAEPRVPAAHSPTPVHPPAAAAVGEERPAVAPIDLAANRERLAAPRDEAARPPSSRGGGSRPAPPARTAAGARSGAAARPTGAGEPDLADYSWTAFWPWARGEGLTDLKAVEDLIGQSAAGVSPARLRELILQARGDRPE